MSKATNVPAVLIEGENKRDRAKEIPGAFFYSSSEEGNIVSSCPCGCGNLGNLNLNPEYGGPRWSNSGTREKPTLSPSVAIPRYANSKDDVNADGSHWHGYLKDGVWVSC